MSDSSLNRRRHGIDLHVRDKDLLTGRDCRRLIAEAVADMDAKLATISHQRAVEHALAVTHNALPWWKRAWAGLAFRLPVSPFAAGREADEAPAVSSDSSVNHPSRRLSA